MVGSYPDEAVIFLFKKHWAIYASATVSIAILILDLQLLHGVAVGVSYVASVLIASLSSYRKTVFCAALVGSLFTLLGYIFSPDGGAPWLVMTNRMLALAAIWVTAIVAYRWKKAANDIRESEARFRDLFERSNLGTHIGTLTKGRTFTNQACAALFGFGSPAEVISASRGSLVAETDRVRVRAINKRLYAGEIGSATYEFEGLKLDGSTIPLQAFAQRFVWEGEPAIQRTFIDLTGQKRAEDKLKASEVGLVRAQRIGNMGSWEWNIVTNELAWSDQIYRIFGLQPQAFGASYSAFLECVHPDDRAFVEGAVQQAVEDHVPYDIEHRIVLPGGEVRAVHEQGEVEYSPTGQPLRMIGTVQDITAQKSAEDAIREGRAMLSGILSIAQEAIILADDKLRITLYSQGAQRVFGYEVEEAIGMNIERLIPERLRGSHQHLVQGFTRGPEKSLQMDARLAVTGLRKNGEEFPAAVSLSKFSSGKGVFYSTILRDIGPESAARDELLAAKMGAEAANQAKSNFLANMSHELRTPLNAIIGFSEAIHGQTFGPVGSPKYIEYVGDINQAGHHLLNIINDILDLSKIEADKVELLEEAVNVSEVVGSCLLLVKERAAAGGVNLKRNVPDNLPPLFADDRMLKQILINLLSNAIKFTPAGGTVEISVWSRPGAGYVFQVADTGIGIALEDIPTALTPFKQIDSALNRKYEGTGLGLPLTKSLAEMHGGSLDLQSAVDGGTTVTVRFPAERIVAEAATGT